MVSCVINDYHQTRRVGVALWSAPGIWRRFQVRSSDEIQVHRINVVEPNGSLRMVISNRARLPGMIVKGKEQPKSDRPQAGMIFYNDGGSENGGLAAQREGRGGRFGR
jgi:hypothetical protein